MITFDTFFSSLKHHASRWTIEVWCHSLHESSRQFYYWGLSITTNFIKYL